MAKSNQPSEFTKNFHRLEEIANRFEQEDVDLEQGLDLYKEAAELVKKLKGRLKIIENEIETVRVDLDQETPPDQKETSVFDS